MTGWSFRCWFCNADLGDPYLEHPDSIWCSCRRMEIWPDAVVAYGPIVDSLCTWRLMVRMGTLYLDPVGPDVPVSESALKLALRTIAVIEVMAL